MEVLEVYNEFGQLPVGGKGERGGGERGGGVRIQGRGMRKKTLEESDPTD